MRAALRSLPFERALAPVVALTIVAFACGSASIASVEQDGRHARWALLVILLVVAAGAAVRAAPRRIPRTAAAAAWLAALAVLSTAWSVDRRLTFERAGSFVLLLAAAALTAVACSRADDAERLLGGVLTGAAVVGLAGLLLLAVDRGAALQHGSTGVPTRFRGLGENADTSALLFGLALPLAVAAAIRARRTSHAVAAIAAFVLFDGSIVGAGSRAPLVAGFAGSLLVALLAPSRRIVAITAVVATLGLSVGLGTIPKPLHSAPKAVPTVVAGGRAKPGYFNAERTFPLDADIGRTLPGRGGAEQPRSLTGSSGRIDAWRGALHQAFLRPIDGHGFGTEAHVFIDRYFFFAGSLPENSYIGLLLQLGLVGLLSFLAVFVLWLAAGARAWTRAGPGTRLTLAACAAALVSGLAMAVVQSYFYSVGNIASLALWLSGFLLVAVAAEAERA